MGYLGFGMRKEVYKRKPKKAFEKVKKLQKPHSKGGSDTGHKASQVYQEIRFKPAYKRTWFWVLAILVLGAITYGYLDQSIFREQRLKATRELREAARRQFETQGIVDFYQTNQDTIQNIANFFESREGKIVSMGRNWSENFWITLRSADYDKKHKGNLSMHSIDYNLDSPHLQPEVIDGKLKCQINRLQRVYSDYWSCNLELKYVQDINTTFLNHLETDYKELGTIVTYIAQNGLTVEKSNLGISFEFNRFGTDYSFHFTDYSDLLIGEHDTTPVKLAEGVYWTR